ncbi:unnamed protein product, partial [marine sediment metagenome]
MAILSYGELKQTVRETLHRADITDNQMDNVQKFVAAELGDKSRMPETILIDVLDDSAQIEPDTGVYFLTEAAFEILEIYYGDLDSFGLQK